MNSAQDRDRAVLLSITAVAAMVIAYLLMFTVLSDPDMTDKLMNGSVAPGTDESGNRAAVVLGIGAALGGWCAAAASRRFIPVALMLLASMPLAPMSLFTLALAFG